MELYSVSVGRRPSLVCSKAQFEDLAPDQRDKSHNQQFGDEFHDCARLWCKWPSSVAGELLWDS